jgi:hypothetical protein
MVLADSKKINELVAAAATLQTLASDLRSQISDFLTPDP